ncbi:hypothetical protein [Salinimicrobium sp. WS361]|uniref:hypothetical protein n=1 Tax=Salinimicrobium sp. WS361 TaxID=3425123 RepID=UPI003D6E836E
MLFIKADGFKKFTSKNAIFDTSFFFSENIFGRNSDVRNLPEKSWKIKYSKINIRQTVQFQ